MQETCAPAKCIHTNSRNGKNMSDTEKIDELDRNMDTVFDSLLILNSTVQALVECLPVEAAQNFVPRMDQMIDSMKHLQNPPDPYLLEKLFGWRNLAATLVKLPVRKPG